jgi:integrase
MLLGLDQETLALSTEQQQLLQRIDLEGWLSRQSNPVAQRLTARSDTPWTEQDICDLVRDVLAFSAATAPVGPPPNADPIGVGDPHSEVSGPACAVQIGQILGKIVAATNEAREAPLPSVGPVSGPRYPVNPFRRDVVTALGRVKFWRKLLPSAITKMGPDKVPSRGLVLLSAALYGGIFDAELLVAVARALGAAPVTLGLANQHLYLQISVAWRGMQDFTRRTWYPDPLTATLIARLAPGQPQGSEEDKDLKKSNRLWNEVIGALQSAGVGKAHEPDSLSAFFADLRVASQLQMPSLLAAYAAHDVRSQGLPARTLERIYSVRPAQPILVDASEPAKSRQQPEDKKVVDSLGENPSEEELDWQKSLRKVLGQKDLRDARRLFDKLLKDEPPNRSATTRLILEFTEDLLSPGTGKKQLRMSTVRPWVRTVIRHIGDMLQESEEDLIARSQVSAEILEDIYREALEGIDPEDETPSVRKKLAHSLRAFHNFLVRKHRVKPLEDTSLLSVHRLGSPVDANLITMEEYHKILEWLDRNWPPTLDPDLQPLARMMVILGFRCGLRRSEALGIKCAAVRGFGPKPELLIQPSSGHLLKSTSAKRRLPLFLLMSEQECQQFLDLAERGNYRPDKRSLALLTIAGSYGLEVSSRRLLPIIHKAMRAVTNDPSLRFHHLRHSFATWTLMRLMIGESGDIPKHFRHLRKTQSWLEESRDFCTQMYDVLPATTRMHAYLMAQMMGHSHPTVTLQYYVHGMDWLLDTCLRSTPDFQPSTRTVALASGLPVRTAYNLAQQGAAAIPVRILTRKWPEMATATPVAAQQILFWPWRAWDLLYRHLSRKDGLPRIAGDYGFSLDQAIGFLQRAKYLRQMHARVRRKPGSKGWQHGMMRRASKPESKRKTRTACPIRPHLETDTNVVTTFASALTRLLDGQPDLIPVLRYYVDNIWKKQNQLFFRNPNQPGDAIAYRKLLEGMGIKRSQHRFFVFHKLQHCEQLEQWKVALGLPKNVSIRRLTPPNADSHSYDSWIGIEPCLSSSTPARGNNSTGTYGFRFLMLMGHIVYGETNIEQVCGDLIQELDKASDSPLKDRIQGSYREKRKWVKLEQFFPIIKGLLLPGGPLYEKTYTERKRLLIAYLQAISETFPDAWADHKRSRYSRQKAASLLIMMELLPDVMQRSCDFHESFPYDLETFKRQLEPVAGLILLGNWRKSTVAISRKSDRTKLVRQLKEALRVMPPFVGPT